jgi:hypothetical protein
MVHKVSRHHITDLPWLIAIASIFTLIVISWSFEHGRLHYEMDYEDIITHIDGLQRWRDLSEGGISQFAAHYLKSPPHAPLHSLMAATSFMLFGVRDWAPYVMNGVLVFLFLLLVRRETRALGTWPSALALLGTLFVPLSFESVHQFRPDFPCALATLWGMILYPRWKEEDFGKKAAISGALFGLALLAKPPVFPYTLAMGGLPWMMAIGTGFWEKRSFRGFWCPILQSWPFFAATSLLAAPHYLLAWKRILGYIQQNQFGPDAHVWRMTGGFGFQVSYHVFGYSGQFIMGHDVWILMGLASAGLLIAIMRRNQDRESCSHFLRLFSFVVWAWIFIAPNPHMNPFFGLTFQYALVLAGMVAAAWIARLALDARFPVRAMVVIPMGLILAVVWEAFPLPQYRQNSASQSFTTPNGEDAEQFGRSLPAEVYRKLLCWRRFSDSGYTLLSTYGIVSSHRLQWLADKDRRDFSFYAVPYWPLEKLIPLFKQDPNEIHHVDFAMVTEAGAEGVFEELPNSKTSGDLMTWINGQDSYTCVETLLTPSKKKYSLFMATPSFSIFDSIEGLGPKSAPLNIKGTPVVRAAMTGKVTLNYDSPASGEATLEIVLRGAPPLARVEVALQGKQTGEFPISPGGNFIAETIRLNLEKGPNALDIRLLDQKGNVLNNPSVQFSRIRVTPPGDTSPMEDIVRKEKRSRGERFDQS